MSTPNINELRRDIETHKEAINKIETQLRELRDTRRNRVIAMETRTIYMSKWKDAVNSGLVENIQDILDDCYEGFICENEHRSDFVEATKKRFGIKGSVQWQEFCILVIQYLRVQDSFIDEDGYIDNYEDTAGGCDEIVYEAAVDLIENPEWKV